MCVFCYLPIFPTEWVCFEGLWRVFSPRSRLPLCCLSFFFTAPHCPSNKRLYESHGFYLFCPFWALSCIDISLCATLSVQACAHVYDNCSLSVGNQRICPGRWFRSSRENLLWKNRTTHSTAGNKLVRTWSPSLFLQTFFFSFCLPACFPPLCI